MSHLGGEASLIGLISIILIGRSKTILLGWEQKSLLYQGMIKMESMRSLGLGQRNFNTNNFWVVGMPELMYLDFLEELVNI